MLFEGCHEIEVGRYRRMEWPNGGSYLEQAAILPRVFSVILDETVKIAGRMK